MSQKHAETERFGGPGASHEDARQGKENPRNHEDAGQRKTADGERNSKSSAVSGGGGEQDRHHAHSAKVNKSSQ